MGRFVIDGQCGICDSLGLCYDLGKETIDKVRIVECRRNHEGYGLRPPGYPEQKNTYICEKCGRPLKANGECPVHSLAWFVGKPLSSRGVDEGDENPQKRDSGKLRYDLIPPIAAKALAVVLTYGAKKYSVDNWRGVEDFHARYTAALYRHIEAWRSGELYDQESGIHHLAHALCNLVFLLWRDVVKVEVPLQQKPR